MAETSNLAKIENVPDHPMQMFDDVLAEVRKIQVVPYQVMCVASVNDEKGVLNRNVILMSQNNDGFVFVTQRDTQKYKDFMKNPAVAATMVWFQPTDDNVVVRQVRINGRITELSEPEIAELYKTSPLHAKIRSKICEAGKPVDWDELKAEHDRVLKAHLDGTEPLKQNQFFTALRICPRDIDFYFTRQDEIADRILYTKQADGSWTNQHIAA